MEVPLEKATKAFSSMTQQKGVGSDNFYVEYDNVPVSADDLKLVKQFLEEETNGRYPTRLKRTKEGYSLVIGSSYTDFSLEFLNKVKMKKPSVAGYLKSKAGFKVRVYAREVEDYPENMALLAGLNFLVKDKKPISKKDLYYQFYKELTRTEIGDIRYGDIGGLKDTIDSFRWPIETPLLNKDASEYMGLEIPRGILFAGPPGCGKSLTAAAIANETKCNFLIMDITDIASTLHTENEVKLIEYFDDANHISSKTERPTIVFLDECERLMYSRAYTNQWDILTTNAFLRTFSSVKKQNNVTFIGATNEPWSIDPAFYREGRIEKVMCFPPPNRDGRAEILKIHLADRPASDINIGELSASTEGYSGADLANLCKEASLHAVKRIGGTPDKFQKMSRDELARKKAGLTMEDFEDAKKSVEINPIGSEAWLNNYDLWKKISKKEDSNVMFM